MKFEFVSAKHHGKVLDKVTLHNTLRRDGICSYCYSRSNGMVLPGLQQRGACSPSTDTTDLQRLHLQRWQASSARNSTTLMPPAWHSNSVDGSIIRAMNASMADHGFGAGMQDTIASHNGLVAHLMAAAGNEIDIQSDDGTSVEYLGYVASYRGPAGFSQGASHTSA